MYYVLKLFTDVGHQKLVRSDRYSSLKTLAYYIGRDSNVVYSWLHQKAEAKGIMRFVEIYKV